MLHGLVINGFFVLYILAVLFIGQKAFKNQELSRKFVHVFLCTWWILMALLAENIIEAIVAPILFTFINFIILTGRVKFTALSDLIRENEIPVGTIIFPFSLFVMVMLSHFLFKSYLIGGIGIVVLAIGDATAALIGKKIAIGKYSVLGNNKTLSGSISMFIVSFLFLILYFSVFSLNGQHSIIALSAFLSLVGSVCEGITPFGIDNLSVPVIVSLTYYLLVR